VEYKLVVMRSQATKEGIQSQWEAANRVLNVATYACSPTHHHPLSLIAHVSLPPPLSLSLSPSLSIHVQYATFSPPVCAADMMRTSLITC
jgi:hypothetical protein